MVEFKKLFNKNVNPESLQIRCVPDDWEDPPPDVGKDEPPFESIDNPGEWSSFSFRLVFKKSAGSSRAKYQYHFQLDVFQLRRMQMGNVLLTDGSFPTKVGMETAV